MSLPKDLSQSLLMSLLFDLAPFQTLFHFSKSTTSSNASNAHRSEGEFRGETFPKQKYFHH